MIKSFTSVDPSGFTLTRNAKPSVVSVVNKGAAPSPANMLKVNVLPSGELLGVSITGPSKVSRKVSEEPYMNPMK